MKINKSNLDEQQEQALLNIEHNACWFAFWGLFAAMVVQLIIYGFADVMKYVAGEWFIFMFISLYMSFACLRKGIWDRKLKANTSTNVILSLIAALISGAIVLAVKIKEYPDSIAGCIATAVFMGGMIFVLVLAALEISRKSLNKRIEELEKEPEEEYEE